ncbi:alpha/beta fold hydrolase [Nocardia xishanensis]|uniref:alpha/beta fold hydrolase n=1 Tax=Nocardia xishanensis TaxID=238964 RepID=UPI00343F1D62
MAKVGEFRNDEARENYLRAYDAMEALWPLPATQVDIQTSFGPTHVRRSGSGPGTPIVLLHQFGGNGLVWHNVVEELAGDRVVYAPDTIGTAGRSIQTAPLNGEADFGAWFEEMLNGLGLERVHLAGYSHGSWHATLAALHASGRVASLTLIEPGGVFTRPKLGVLLKMIWFGMRGKSDENMRETMAWLSPGAVVGDLEFACGKAALHGYRMRIGWARMLKDAELRSITVPTLVIFGGDTLVADTGLATRRIAANVPHGTTEIYPGTAHGILYQIPDRISRRILTFVQQHDRSEVR